MLVQGDSVFEWEACANPAYLAQMTSAFNSEMKMVFQLWGDEWDKMKELNEDTMSMFEMKVDDIKTMLHTIRLKINKIRHFFFMHSGSMSKDTNQVDSNFERINFWSTVHLIMMLVVGVTQVVMVRNFFCDKSISKI